MSVKAGRLLALGFEGVEVPQRLVDFHREHGLGALILFRKNCPDAETVRRIADFARAQMVDPVDGWTPLIMVDQEGGRVQRIRDGVPQLPSALEMSALGEEKVAELAYGQSAALKALGVGVNLAPVCDIVRRGESGVIGDRSFGGDKEVVARMALAFHQGMMRAGLAGSAKHFPGHGASPKDTHLEAGVIDLDEKELMEVDLHPYRALISHGLKAVMAAHVVYPKVDAKPACLSKKWLCDILRRDLGFEGAVISDDMEMAAVAGRESPERTALAALNAGCDLLIFGQNLKRDADPFVVARHLEANLEREKLAASVRRLWRLRE